MTMDSTTTVDDGTLFLGEAWSDPIEAGIRDRIRGFIEELIEEELAAALGRGRYQRRHRRGGKQVPTRALGRAPAVCGADRPRRSPAATLTACTDMIYATTPKEVEQAQSVHPQVAAEVPGGRRQPGGSRRPAVHLHPPATRPVALGAHQQCRRTAARGIQAPHQDPDRPAVAGDRGDAVLGAARLRADHHAQGRRLADPGDEADRRGH